MNAEFKKGQEIAAKLVDAALSRGYTVSVNDGEAWVLKRSTIRPFILEAMFSTGEDVLVFRNEEGTYLGQIVLIYGNGEDVVSDCSMHKEITALICEVQPEFA